MTLGRNELLSEGKRTPKRCPVDETKPEQKFIQLPGTRPWPAGRWRRCRSPLARP